MLTILRRASNLFGKTKSLGGVIINLNNASNFSAFAFILISIPVKNTGCFSKFSQNQKKDRPK